MFAAITPITLTLLAAAAIYVRADPNPTSPGPGDVFIQGQPCPISWDVDPTGLWKTMAIELMTGNNYDMSSLTTVGTVDGTNPSKNTFSYACPEVSPHSPIYFYQFTSRSTGNKTWTGRFAITDSAKNIAAPSQSVQPDGQKIAWGTGSLVNGSASAAPSTPVATSPASSSVSSTISGSLLSSTSAPNTSAVHYLTSYASVTPSALSNKGTNGAMAIAVLSVSDILFHTALALALGAFGFTVMF